MFDAQLSFPGFDPDQCAPLVFPVAPVGRVALPARKPLVAETASYLRAPRNANVWPRMPLDLWSRSFSQLERAGMNLEAIKIASALPAGQQPTDDERRSLNLFNGWGALSAMFQPASAGGLPTVRAELEQLVGADAMKDVLAATTTSFFTPPAVVRALWSGLEAMGFKGGNILEPSAGHGMFLGQMPEAIAKRSQVTAIELDKATCSVLRSLYGPHGVNVIEGAFEKTNLPQGFFDAVITNVPFGDFGVPEKRNVPFRNFRIHDYFLARAMEVVRPGGLVAVITSAGTMDKQSDKVRAYLATKARLVGAVRLPVEAFKVFAGTSPVTDVLVFQRRELGRVEANGAEWEDLKLVKPSNWHQFPYGYTAKNRGVPVNQWFADHMDHVLGELTVVSGQYGYQPSVQANGDWQGDLQRIMSLLPPGAYQAAAPTRREANRVEVTTELQPGSFILDDTGTVCTVESPTSAVEVVNLNATVAQRIIGMIGVRDAAKALLVAQVDARNDEQLVSMRLQLNAAYDKFVKRHGWLNASANTKAFAGDPAATLLQSIEVERPGGTYGKADVFSRRTVNARLEVTYCESASDALKASLAVRGRIDHDWMAKLTGRESGDVMNELARDALVFFDPKSFTWVESGEYLSGNVRQKLREAELAGESWAHNAEALRNVVPEDLLPCDIHASFGATWISVSDYEAFVTEVFDVNCTIGFDAITGSWSVSTGSQHGISQQLKNEFGVTGYIQPLEMMQKSMNRQQPTLTDADPLDSKKRIINQVKTIEAREKQSALDARFIEWLWSDSERSARLARIYNDTFNSVVNRKFDGSHLVLPGFSQCFELHAHQKNAIWRIVTQPTNALLAHQVGFGKSLEMIGAGMELKRLGVASKIAYVVPNATLGAFVKEFVRAYPAANLHVATEKDFASDNRRRFLARAATGNWDAVVIAHSSFERIRLSDGYANAFIASEIQTIEAAIRAADDKRSLSVKQLERAKRQWEARLAKTANAKGDTGGCLAFDEIGFDWLMVDEAHYFKNLYRFSKMERVAGLPDSNSERAFDMFLKCNAVAERHDGKRGIVFATGTPVANSIGELYTMQRFLQSTTLDQCDMASFDAWASNFGEVVTGLEISPDGSGYRMNRRFSRFVNIPELMTMFREVADIQVGSPPCLKLPAVMREVVAAKASPLLKAFVEELVKRAEAIRDGRVRPNEDNMLSVTGDGRKAALDMRLIDRRNADDPEGKLNLCVRNVHAIWQETANERLTQLIFSDMGTPGSVGFSVYADIRNKLVAAGVPESEIAFAHDASTHVARAKLQQDVRDGHIRIVIGSTQKLGVGVNVQSKLVAIHHLDAPWRPADIEQREGRIIRQGNANESVRIFRYVTEGSFDAYMWQTLETKAKFIAQIMTGESVVRTAEDLEMAALSYSEVKALASGNPMVIEKAGVDAEVAKLSVMKAAHAESVYRAKRTIVELPRHIEALTRRKAALTEMAATLGRMPQPTLVVGKQAYANLEVIGKVIHDAAVAHVFGGANAVVVGMVDGMELTVSKPLIGKGYNLSLNGDTQLRDGYDGGPLAASHAFRRLMNVADVEKLLETVTDQIVRNQRDIEESRFVAVQVFAQEARYREVLARQVEINAALGTADGVVGEAVAA